MEVFLALAIPLLFGFLVIYRSMERQKGKGTKRTNTDGVLAVGNHVYDPRTPLQNSHGDKIDHVDVYLPGTMDYVDKLYAQYLLENCSADVTVHFTEEELWKHR